MIDNEIAVIANDTDIELVGKTAIITYMGKTVVNLRAAAKILNVKEATLNRSFMRANKQYTDNIDVFTIPHDEAKSINDAIVAAGGEKYYAGRKGLRLYSEKGLLLLATKAHSDEAWAVVHKTVDGFLKGRLMVDALALAETALSAERLAARALTNSSETLSTIKGNRVIAEEQLKAIKAL